MDRPNQQTEATVTNQRSEKRGGFFRGIYNAIISSFAKRKEGIESPIYDVLAFVIAFLFARCHIIFGAYPIALAIIAVLPSRVWLAVGGAVAGALTLGNAGVIYSMISVIVAFLRIIISATDKHKIQTPDGTEASQLFHESLLLRMSSAIIGGFIAAVYEILLAGFTLASVLFGVTMIILPALITFALSGLFDAGVTWGSIFAGSAEVFSMKRRKEKEKFNLIFFQCSALLAIFLISLSLKQYELLGVSAGYVFAGMATIFVARRFGALRGAAVGFVSSVGISSIHSVAFALAGLAAGALCTLSLLWAAIAGGVVLVAWSSYAEGLSGLLTTLPEYAISAAISVPLFKKTKLERTEEDVTDSEGVAEDMVGTMALSYKSRYSGSLDSLESAFSALASLTKEERARESAISEREVERLVSECISRYFDVSNIYMPGADEARTYFASNMESIATKVYKNGKITPAEFDTPEHLAQVSVGVADSINRAMGIITEERYRDKTRDTSAEDFSHMAKLINEARLGDSREKSLNTRLTEAVCALLSSLDITGAAAQVFGERAPHFIIATEDEVGNIITSPKLKKGLEEVAGVKLAIPEYYRRGKMALMECGTAPAYIAGSAFAGDAIRAGEVSGDTARTFSTEEHRYFSLISDGMGSGEGAHATSMFVADFLSRMLEFGAGAESSLSLLNNLVRRRREECSATVDLFSLDLISGEAVFYKCGAAPSYVKRGTSLFRIRSRTSPLGLMSQLDAERIRVEVESGDYIIMFSDGVSPDGEATWLLDLLSCPAPIDPSEYARTLLEGAKRNSGTNDDLSVLVTKIIKE